VSFTVCSPATKSEKAEYICILLHLVNLVKSSDAVVVLGFARNCGILASQHGSGKDRLAKTYGDVEALEALDLAVYENPILGFLGPLYHITRRKRATFPG
jgi:hypothetical protein